MVLKTKINREKVPDLDEPLSIHKLNVIRGTEEILRNVSFQVSRGEILGIHGVNGSGKSTFVEALSGVTYFPQSSISTEHALLNGEDIFNMHSSERYDAGLHFVFQGRRLFPDLSVKENLQVVMSRQNSTHFEKRISEVLELFPRMDELLDKKAKGCSAAQQQIVAIARAIMVYPKVLILDEPTLGLSKLSIEGIVEALKILASGSVSVIILEQRRGFLQDIADRILNLERGTLVEPIGEVLRASEWKPKIDSTRIAEPIMSVDMDEDVDEDDEWKPL